MKRIIISFLLAYLVTGLTAQSSPEPEGTSLEFNIGIGKIGVFGNDGFILGLNNPSDYDAEYITKKDFSILHLAIFGMV